MKELPLLLPNNPRGASITLKSSIEHLIVILSCKSIKFLVKNNLLGQNTLLELVNVEVKAKRILNRWNKNQSWLETS
jgi:hypothetical protein